MKWLHGLPRCCRGMVTRSENRPGNILGCNARPEPAGKMDSKPLIINRKFLQSSGGGRNF